MSVRVAALLAVAASVTAADQPQTVQFAFYRFAGERVRVSVDGRTVVDRVMSVDPANARLGLAAVAQVVVPRCAALVVATARRRIERRLCTTPATRSIAIGAGPPLTIEARDRYQGVD